MTDKKNILICGTGEMDNIALRIAGMGLKQEDLIIIESTDTEKLAEHGISQEVADKIKVGEIESPNTKHIQKSFSKPIELKPIKLAHSDYSDVEVKQYIRSEPKISRNALCACGSGKKYKKCCGG